MYNRHQQLYSSSHRSHAFLLQYRICRYRKPYEKYIFLKTQIRYTFTKTVQTKTRLHRYEKTSLNLIIHVIMILFIFFLDIF